MGSLDSDKNDLYTLPDSSGDPLLDLLLPLLSPEDRTSISKHKNAALESVAKLRSSNLDVIMGTLLEQDLTSDLNETSTKLSNLALKSYPQFLQSAVAVDTLLTQFVDFEKTANDFYESQFSYIDQEIHHYLALSTSSDGEKLGENIPNQSTVGTSVNGSLPDGKSFHRRRSNSTLKSVENNRKAQNPDSLQNNTQNTSIGVIPPNGENLPASEEPKKHVEDAVILLKNLDRIQDILELPSLILVCVNNGYYAEALDLAAHTSRLAKRYSHVQVIQDIQQQVDDALKTMTVQLLQLLKESVKLPTLIKVVSYLRRIPPFSNRSQQQQQQQQAVPSTFAESYNQQDVVTRQLQQLYLFSRLQYIRGLLLSLEPLKKQSADSYLKRYVEVFREHVFVTVVGFRSVFPDSPVSSSLSSSEVSTSSTSQALPSKTFYINNRVGDNLISFFIRALVNDFYKTIIEISPFVDDETTRNSLWLQISYCSKSLGRVGADFWPTVQGPEDTCAGEGTLSKKEWIAAIQKQLDISKHYSNNENNNISTTSVVA